MGILDGGRSYSSSDLHARNSKGYRAHSPARSTRSTHSSASKSGNYFVRPSAGSRTHSSSHNNHSSSRGIFDTGRSSGSSRGIFGFGGGGGSGSSYYKRSPRQGYVSYLYNKLRRMLKELWYYARRHPMKAFFAVIVPLLSAGGAIGGLMRQFGVKIPGGMGGGDRRGGGGYYGSAGYDRRGGGFGESGGGGIGGGIGSMLGGGGGGGLMQNAGGLMSIAKAFM
ncbi:hypothetical protein LTR09_010450 [Extremus antarcticus]|uniref:Uncharacterized protein n=1 Tax=Extremus antarcticus TaxID=702011 RepID=A0AAJ0DDM1_9PEZI|nr:hypothetical protein LTR09_010450 [Extremus antarcticus]